MKYQGVVKMKYQCAVNSCKSRGKFYIYQNVFPQILGNGEVETAPAGRSIIVCGNHLSNAVYMMSSLEYRKNEPVQVRLLPTS